MTDTWLNDDPPVKDQWLNDDPPAPPEQSPEQSWWQRGAVRPTTLTMSDVGKVGELAKVSATAFGHGFEEGFGTERIGLKPDNAKALQKLGLFAPEDKTYSETGWRAPFYAMNDILTSAIALGGEGGFRGLNGVYRGLQQVGLEFGLPRDVVSIPDAFMGSPHPMGVPKVAREKLPAPKEADFKAAAETLTKPSEGDMSWLFEPTKREQVQTRLGPGVFEEGDKAVIEGAPRADYIERIASGNEPLPTTKELSDVIEATRGADLKYSQAIGLSEAEHKRLRTLDQMIDEGSDAAIAEKNKILSKVDARHELDIPDEGSVRQLRTEFASLERSGGETAAEHLDGIARVLKRYVGQVIDGDPLARAVFRKAMEEAEKAGFDTKALGRDAMSRLLGDLSESDQAFMRKEFEAFLRPKLPKYLTPAETAEANLRTLWEERGIHPADVVDAVKNQPIEAHHGSPHDFEAFDLSRIGAGEGNQSFGYGLYFAENKLVSEDYVKMNHPGNTPESLAHFYLKSFGDPAFGGRENAIRHLKEIADQPGPSLIDPKIVKEAAKLLESGATPKAGGTLYQVRINANREHMLDWDKPLSEQSPEIKAALSKIETENKPAESPSWDLAPRLSSLREYQKSKGGGDITGGNFVKAMEAAYGEVETSKMLHEAGIPGIKYFDQGSRAVGEKAKGEDVAIRLLDSANDNRAKAIAEGERRIASSLEPEKIVAAAVRTDKGVFRGVTHATASSLAEAKGVDISKLNLDDIDGFVTSKGRYVSREEAAQIADAADQRTAKDSRLESSTVNYRKGDYDVLTREQALALPADRRPRFPDAPYYKVGRAGTESEGELAGYPSLKEANQAAGLQEAGADTPLHQAVELLKSDWTDPRTRNFVVFDDKLIDITHKNGEALDLKQAVDLGVVGPERPPITEGKPAEAAQRAVSGGAPPEKPPAGGGPGDGAKPPAGGDGNPWRERFDQFVGKLKTPEDAKTLIRNAADENAEFQAARQGDIPLKQFEDLARASGVDPMALDRSGIGRLLQNDNQVRNAMQAMLTATENVKTAARDVKLDPSPANLMKLQEAMLRRDTWVEQVVGHRAEWGRTGNVFQEFLQQVKNEETFNQFLKDKDRTPEGLRKIADMVEGLDGAQAARLLNDANKPTWWDMALWYWINGLISGPVTHTKYIVANAAFGAYESAIVTPIAGAIGTVRRAVTRGGEGVYVGEAAARVWGLVAGVPDAIKGAAKAGWTGLQTALPGEVAQGIIPKQNKNIAYQQKPIPGAWGTVIGLPSRGASAIHSFFNFLGYRASMEAQAYRAAAKDGFSVKDDAFWQRRAEAADKPSVEMMNIAVEEGYRLTYITELGPFGKGVSEFVNTPIPLPWTDTKIQPMRLIMPFVHIPLNVAKRAVEGTPLAFLGAETGRALSGKLGAVKQDMAVARLIAGGAVGAYVVNLFLNDRITGFGPTEPKERAQWLATGHMPYAVRIGDEWYSFNRFGSIGTMMGLYSNLAEIIPHMEGHDEDLTKAIAMVVHSTGRLLEDEVGMQGLAGLIEAINEPERKGSRFVANFAGSFLPNSSLLRQTASWMDPYMREAKTVVDGLRYYIPVLRQELLPKRDWLGEPIHNAGYENLIRHQPVGTDPLAFEMKELDLHPAAPVDRIGGVKLPPKMYDEYQSVAGAFTRQTLETIIAQEGWENVPKFARQEVFRNTIRSTRQAAAAVVQARNPELIRAGIEQRMDQIQGRKPTKLQDARQ